MSRSGYYKYLTRDISAHQQRRKQLREHTMALFEKFQKRYGAPRLTRALKAENVPCCVNTIAKIMQQLQLRARNGRAFRYSQYSHSNVRMSQNVLRRQFVATKPNTKWVTDITYIRFKGQ
ncbi:IS3 family transposase [uncultured Alteromonas sp.]|uniref:IS3 family transposase n=1 Tax=uncultured Alteromonas sp. TaxID=179113 RepID=UPI0030D19802